MGETVYADLLFLINFSMDYLCFYVTAKLLRRPLPKLRAFFASVGGGLYSVLILISGFVAPLELVCDLGAGLLMCIAVFSGKNVSFGKFCLHSLAYVGVSVALGGIMTATFNMLSLLGLPTGDISEGGDGMPVWLFALLAAVSGAATLAGGRFFRKKQSERTADIEIFYEGRAVKLNAVCDTGNLLRDPVSGKCVIVADMRPMRRILPPAFIDAAKRRDASKLTSLPQSTAKRLRLVPSKTATGGGILFALAPDKLTVSVAGGKPYEVDALIAPADVSGASDGFDALIPSELLV